MEKEQILLSIQDEFDMLSDKDKLTVINEYMEQNSYPYYSPNTEEELTTLCEDSLTKYFEQLAHSQHYDKGDDYFTVDGNGWIRSLENIDSVADEVNLEELAEYVYEHFSDFDHIFTDTADAIEEDEDEEE